MNLGFPGSFFGHYAILAHLGSLQRGFISEQLHGGGGNEF